MGGYACGCAAGFQSAGSGLTAACVDVNECGSSSACGKDLSSLNSCTNTVGAFTCGCGAGYTTTGSGTTLSCGDVNECATTVDVRAEPLRDERLHELRRQLCVRVRQRLSAHGQRAQRVVR